MKMEISFPGGKKVDSNYNGYTVSTDQPVKDGGDDTAPSPFELFLSSMGTCMGYYALAFCRKHKVEHGDLKVTLDFDWNEKKFHLDKVAVKIILPDNFSEKLKPAIIRSVNLCAVKKHLTDPPEFEIETN